MNFQAIYFFAFALFLILLIVLIRILNEIKRSNFLLTKVLFLNGDNELDEKDKEAIEKLIVKGKKNEAIKLYRKCTKVELLEAVDAIDKMINKEL
ncbi:50S ribosomal protein L7/L12 [Helicovermis profundi]|uniref:Ribosomal protein L7/L12 C-terminal domain-containing protein n=1 Tax=Helicovermis profundi TaxID=3065157 RepID=A0AAU9EB51_9FIRM|nr:hypothetical protein HLPR_23680 [Clostridia bacterium S502]